MSNPIVLTPLQRTSPSVWSHMRLCGLRAALAATQQCDAWVLHDPRLWLGAAFHQLMDEASKSTCSAAQLEPAWDRTIAATAAVAAKHRLDSRFADVKRWPGYFLVRQR